CDQGAGESRGAGRSREVTRGLRIDLQERGCGPAFLRTDVADRIFLSFVNRMEEIAKDHDGENGNGQDQGVKIPALLGKPAAHAANSKREPDTAGQDHATAMHAAGGGIRGGTAQPVVNVNQPNRGVLRALREHPGNEARVDAEATDAPESGILK